MKSSASKIKMTSFDGLFDTGEDTGTPDGERILQIPVQNLFPFESHPFKVLDDEKMEETKESIERYGVLMPIIARPKVDGGYEIISGHRRKRACELLEIEKIPTIVRDLNDEESTIIMVDSNIQRENLLFSEKAFAFKMKLDAIKRKSGRRSKDNGTQLGHHSDEKKSVEIVADQSGESRNQIQRYIRLTELAPILLSMVDEKKLAFNTAVELSYLLIEEQQLLLEKIEELSVIPSMAQATKLKKYSGEGNLTDTLIDVILSEGSEKPVQVTLKANRLTQYFPKNYTTEEMEETIIKLLEEWKRKN